MWQLGCLMDELEEIGEYASVIEGYETAVPMVRLRAREMRLRMACIPVSFTVPAVGFLVVAGHTNAACWVAAGAALLMLAILWLARRTTIALMGVPRGEVPLAHGPVGVSRLIGVLARFLFYLTLPAILWGFYWWFYSAQGRPLHQVLVGTAIMSLCITGGMGGIGAFVDPRRHRWSQRINLATFGVALALDYALILPSLLAAAAIFSSRISALCYLLSVVCQGSAIGMAAVFANLACPVPLMPNGRDLPGFPCSLYSRSLSENRLARSVAFGGGATFGGWVLMVLLLAGVVPAVGAVAAGAGLAAVGIAGLNSVVAVFALLVFRVRAASWPQGEGVARGG